MGPSRKDISENIRNAVQNSIWEDAFCGDCADFLLLLFFFIKQRYNRNDLRELF